MALPMQRLSMGGRMLSVNFAAPDLDPRKA
jgi:hypothetical protein